jgi:hypothetical protein
MSTRLTPKGLMAYGLAQRMRRFAAVSIVILSAVLIQKPTLVQACGEKLLLLGRGIRFQSRHTPRAAAVLLYVPNTGSGRPLSDPNIESALKEAGHTVRAVTTSADLESAVRRGTYDVVLADITDALDLERARAIPGQNAVVLPAVYLVSAAQLPPKQQTKADRDSAAKAFGVMVEVPGRPGHYCAAVDKAMELKLKRERSSSQRP